MKKLALVLALLTTPAYAQSDYFPPTRDQWINMVQALQNIPMSASAHQQMSQILLSTLQQAQPKAPEGAPQVAPKKD